MGIRRVYNIEELSRVQPVLKQEEVVSLREIDAKIPIPDHVARKFLASRDRGEGGVYDTNQEIIDKMEVLSKKMVKKLQEIETLEEVVSRLTVKKMKALERLEEGIRMGEVERLEEIRKQEEIRRMQEVSKMEDVVGMKPVEKLQEIIDIHELTPEYVDQLMAMLKKDKYRRGGRLSY